MNDYSNRLYPQRPIRGQDILEMVGMDSIVIGKTTEYCKEIEAIAEDATRKAEEYYSKLVELGEIVPEKSQEEKTAELMAGMLEQMKIMTEEIKVLKGVANE